MMIFFDDGDPARIRRSIFLTTSIILGVVWFRVGLKLPERLFTSDIGRTVIPFEITFWGLWVTNAILIVRHILLSLSSKTLIDAGHETSGDLVKNAKIINGNVQANFGKLERYISENETYKRRFADLKTSLEELGPVMKKLDSLRQSPLPEPTPEEIARYSAEGMAAPLAIKYKREVGSTQAELERYIVQFDERITALHEAFDKVEAPLKGPLLEDLDEMVVAETKAAMFRKVDFYTSNALLGIFVAYAIYQSFVVYCA